MAKKWDEVKASKDTILAGLKTLMTEAGSDATAKAAVTAANTKMTSIKKWPPDPGTLTALKGLYDKAYAAVSAIVNAPKVQVSLSSTTKPKFMHNASSAGTKPKWTFGYTDTVSKKSGSVVIEMTANMTKDENTAKKLMADAALAKVKGIFPNAASVSIVSSTMATGD